MISSYNQAVFKGIRPKALVLINPNNPTGSVLSRSSLEELIMFCYDHSLMLIADEVYQHNVYGECLFISAKKAVCEAPAPYNMVELASINSISKGFMGECGLRGGYLEFHNVDPKVLAHYDKIKDIGCVNVTGSIATEIMCNPPRKGIESDEVVELDLKERLAISEAYEIKAKMLYESLNQMAGIKCEKIMGALYGFPRVFMSETAKQMALERDMSPDEFFCVELLEKTGIVTVPGSGFGQLPGTYHFRIAIIMWDLEEFKKVLEAMREFVSSFFERYK